MRDMTQIGLMAVAGLLAAIVTDLDAYIKARGDNETIKFAWGLALARWCKGAIMGAIAGAGFGI